MRTRTILTVLSVIAVVAIGLGWLMIPGAWRPPAPPDGVATLQPWGALDMEDLDPEPEVGFERSFAAALAPEYARAFDVDHDGKPNYPLLALSGGGSNGAFGAGLLVGWSELGTRPRFKVVTGVSTGGLMATYAFLGSDYDAKLRQLYTTLTTSDVYTSRLIPYLTDALNDTTPLKRLIAKHITQDILAAVAREHSAGRRLYVGTTDLDDDEFVIWDLGAIAASNRTDKLDQYRNALLASGSIPYFFPPVYFEVQVEGETYSEMHVDGGAKAAVFFRGFMLDYEDALEANGLTHDDVEANLYVIVNSKAREGPEPSPVRPGISHIAGASVASLYNVVTTSNLYRMYVLAERNGIEFRLATIPDDYPLGDSKQFDTAQMSQLFSLGYELAKVGYPWLEAPPGLDPDELIKTGEAP